MNTLDFTFYEGNEAAAVAELVGGRWVLDCGCGTGRIARAVQPNAEAVWGIELSATAAAAAEVVCDRVVTGSLTDPATWRHFGDARFDVVLFIHVLEHLTEPDVALRAGIARLRPGGRVVVALPNVANWRVRWDLARGRWDDTSEGIMDRTHVRFYTLKTAIELLAANGLLTRSARLFFSPPSGSAVRCGLVYQVRRTAPLLFAHSFIFECIPE